MEPLDLNPNTEELKKKLFDPEQYSTLIIAKEGDLVGGFDKYFDFVSKRENIEFKEDALVIFKQEVSIEAVIDFLKHEKDEKKRELMLATVWEAGLDATKHMAFWIDQAIKGSFQESIEVLSIVENTESTLPSKEVEELQSKLKLAKKEDEHADKAGILDAIEEALEFIK